MDELGLEELGVALMDVDARSLARIFVEGDEDKRMLIRHYVFKKDLKYQEEFRYYAEHSEVFEFDCLGVDL